MESLFNTGHSVGSYAKQLFPGGVAIDFTPYNFNGMIQKTTELIQQGANTLYEAAFRQDGIFAMADILHRSGNRWDVYEVKASTATKPYHIDDAAIQYYVFRNALDINNRYVRKGELDVAALFTIVVQQGHPEL